MNDWFSEGKSVLWFGKYHKTYTKPIVLKLTEVLNYTNSKDFYGYDDDKSDYRVEKSDCAPGTKVAARFYGYKL